MAKLELKSVHKSFQSLEVIHGIDQVIELFPSGGGGYLVASKLLGRRVGVVSGCALLVDYVLTVTTSIAAAGACRPAMQRAIVVLPLPDSPTRATHSPAEIENETSRTTNPLVARPG